MLGKVLITIWSMVVVGNVLGATLGVLLVVVLSIRFTKLGSSGLVFLLVGGSIGNTTITNYGLPMATTECTNTITTITNGNCTKPYCPSSLQMLMAAALPPMATIWQ